jgi:hypothetical protein
MFPDRAVTAVVTEGGFATLTGRISEPDPLDFFILDVNWGDGTPTETYTYPPGSPRDIRIRHRYLDNPAGTLSGQFPISLSWRDQHGGGNSGVLQVTVLDAVPVVQVGPDVTLRSGQPLRRAGSFSDAGIVDTWTATVDYGDGSGVQALHLRRDGTFVLDHHYSRPGTYHVTVAVTDDEGAVGRASFQVTVASRGAAHAAVPPARISFADALFALLGVEEKLGGISRSFWEGRLRAW